MSPHYTRINIVKTIGLTTYLHSLGIFNVVYIDLNQMLISFEYKESFWFVGFSMFDISTWVLWSCASGYMAFLKMHVIIWSASYLKE